MMSWDNNFDDFKNTGKMGMNFNMQSMQTSNYGGNSGSKTSEVVKILDFSSSYSYVNIIGLVISKDGAKSIMNKKGVERHLLAITVRDSEKGFINVTFWGSEGFIQSASQSAQIGDVVTISNAQIQSKSNNGMDDKYRPWTPSQYQLNVSENHGNIEPYSGWDVANFRDLQHIPIKANNDYYTLEDINVNGMSLQGEHVNILAAVKQLGKIRDITTKTGKPTKKCEVILFDETCSHFTLDLWNVNVDLAQLWMPHQTVIFAADVKIIHNEYKAAMIAVADSKSIFTIDPDTQESYSLHSFAVSDTSWTSDTSFQEGNSSFTREPDPDLNSIKDIYSIEQIKKKSLGQSEYQVDYGIAYLFLSSFDIDSEDKPITRKVCQKCRRTLRKESSYVCLNQSCAGPADDSIFQDNHGLEYNISVSLSDHTGTIDFCQLQPLVAENIFGLKAEYVNEMNLEKLTEIKWNYLLERCKVIFKLQKSFRETVSRISVRVISLELADPQEVYDYFTTL